MCFLNWLRNCILYQRPITSKSTIGLGTLGSRKVKKLKSCTRKVLQRRMPVLSHHAETKGETEAVTCFLLHHHRGKKKKILKKIIQQLIHDNTNNKMSLTSISLLDRTHFVWQVCCTRKVSRCICRDMLCVCFWGFLLSPPHRQLHDRSRYTPGMFDSVFKPPFTRHIQNMMSSQVKFRPRSARKKIIGE